jgi:hypothetical protein
MIEWMWIKLASESIASSFWYYARVICCGLDRWHWMALIVMVLVIAAPHSGNNTSYSVKDQVFLVKIY